MHISSKMAIAITRALQKSIIQNHIQCCQTSRRYITGMPFLWRTKAWRDPICTPVLPWRFLYRTTPHVRRICTESLKGKEAPSTADKDDDSIVLLKDDITLNNDGKELVITWGDGDTQAYPYPWLRDNCMCESCYNHSTYSRNGSIHDLDVEAIPNKVGLSGDKTALMVSWPDDHNSQYTNEWLKGNRFNQSKGDNVFVPKYRYWGSDLEKSLCSFELSDVLEDDKVLLKMLMELKTLGFCRIAGGGTMSGQVEKLANRIAFLHYVYFGATADVKFAPGTNHISYTNAVFPMHTDLAYKGRPPGVLVFHCIQQAKGEGGENLFTDGFKVALDLKQLDPVAFDLLCNAPLEFKDLGTYESGEFYQRSCHSTIGLNRYGHPDHIYLSDHGREAMMRIPVDQVLPLYRALKTFSDLYHHPENVFVYKQKEGDILVLDNRRVIHGRAAFSVNPKSNRHLQTGYMEWDEINSKIRLLMRDLKILK